VRAGEQLVGMKTLWKSKEMLQACGLLRVEAMALLSMNRVSTYGLLSMLVGAWMVLSMYHSQPYRTIGNVDFPAFYNAGRIVNEGGNLYDAKLQEDIYLRMEDPAHRSNNIRYFAYTPFFALIFAPLARLPYGIAFVTWGIISSALFVIGFLLAWKALGLPTEHRNNALLIAFSFLPFFAWTLLVGQVTAFGFFSLALAIYFERTGRPLIAGCALSLILYKPTLLILIVPMLLITKRWRLIQGFVVGAIALGIISLSVIGVHGVPSYLEMLHSFSAMKVSGVRHTLLEIDAYSFFGLLMGNRVAGVLTALLAIAVAPLLWRAWRSNPDQAWQHVITWTLVLNLYVLFWDMTLLILPVLMSSAQILKARSELPRAFKVLFVILFVAPWFERGLSAMNFQIVTVAIAAFGLYHLPLPRVNTALNDPALVTRT
jgi:hypothetical protein